MNYIALDFEWNQSYMPRVRQREDFFVQLDGEIIQIGAVMMDESFHIKDTFTINIRPVFYRKIHKKVRALTGIDQQQLNNGYPFAEAMRRFVRWCGREHLFFTWGPDDARIMMQNLLIHKYDTAWMGRWINLQVIYNMQTDGGSGQKSLETALAHFGISQELTAHNALHDALYTAYLCGKLDVPAGIQNYSGSAKLGGLRRISCGSFKMLYNCGSKQRAFAHEQIRYLSCPYCSKRLEELKAWIKQSGDSYMTLGRCPAHGRFMGKVRFIRERDGSLTAKYSLYVSDRADEQYYAERLKANSRRARRRRKARSSAGT